MDVKNIFFIGDFETRCINVSMTRIPGYRVQEIGMYIEQSSLWFKIDPESLLHQR